MEKQKQIDRVLDYLLKYTGITDKEARDNLGCTRLSARIWDIRNKYGVNVKVVTIKQQNRYGEMCRVARYYITEEERNRLEEEYNLHPAGCTGD